MLVDVDPSWAAAVFLIAVRLGVILIMTPIYASLSGLVTLRVFLTLSLTVLLVQGLDVRPASIAVELGPLLLAAVLEVFVGATLAFGVFAAFGAFSVAGKILDIQSGFGLGSVFDPVTRSGAPLFGTIFNLLAVAVFFGMQGHHAFLKGIAFSLEHVPPGAGLTALPLDAVMRQFGMMFSLGVALIAPVMFCLFLIEAGLALMSRVLPQMNVFVVGIPVKIVATLALLAATVSYLGPVMGRVYASIFHYWEQAVL